MKLPERTVLSDVIYLPSEGTVVLTGTEQAQTGHGRVQIHFREGLNFLSVKAGRLNNVKEY